MKLSIATAILGKAYLKANGFFTYEYRSYDLRPFEYQDKNDTYIKVEHLVSATEHLPLTQFEKTAWNILKESGVKSVKSDHDHIGELIKL